MTKALKIDKGRLEFVDKQILGFVFREIVESSSGAVVYAPKEHIGKKVYLVICK